MFAVLRVLIIAVVVWWLIGRIVAFFVSEGRVGSGRGYALEFNTGALIGQQGEVPSRVRTELCQIAEKVQATGTVRIIAPHEVQFRGEIDEGTKQRIRNVVTMLEPLKGDSGGCSSCS